MRISVSVFKAKPKNIRTKIIKGRDIKMANYISIDGGTTNTRINLVTDGKITATKKYNIGAGAGAEGKELLKTTVAQGISEILEENSLSERDITRILASGMITSEFGLCLLPHAVVPVGIKEMKEASHEVSLSEISSIPFVFMRGVKTDCSTLETADMMRGEETELMGIAKSEYGKSIYALMGSHTKMIKTDSDGKITDFVTLLTGEFCAAIANNTILKNSFILGDNELSEAYLLKGFAYCRQHGTGEALFKVRILKNLFNCSEDRVYSFYLGVVLCSDAEYVLESDAETVVVAGNKALRNALALLLKERSGARIINLPDDEVNNSVALGQIRIYETEI